MKNQSGPELLSPGRPAAGALSVVRISNILWNTFVIAAPHSQIYLGI